MSEPQTKTALESVEVTAPPYRPQTLVARTEINLVFNNGGIGDYIHWIGAMKHAINQAPHIYGHILAPTFFYDLAELWLGKYSSRYKVLPLTGLDNYPALTDHPYVKGKACIIPDDKQYANACGYHLTDLGFTYYTQKNKVAPEYTVLPEIRGDEVSLERFNLPSRYAVIPSEATAEVRMMPASVLNELTRHLISRSVTPVFLGKNEIARDYKSTIKGDVDLSGVMDLRNQTTLVEAACIMARAEFVLGMDGGLLHLAACSDVPVVFIFTTVHPNYRIPYARKAGAETVVVTPPKELGCRFCNTGDPDGASMLYVLNHDFKDCLYKDNLCTKLISAKTLIPVMDKLLERK